MNIFHKLIPSEYRKAKIVADGFLAQQEFNPAEVYAFLKTLEGAPDIANIGFENTDRYRAFATVTAEYTGDGVWGGLNKDYNIASDEFKETAKSIFEALAKYTGYTIKSVGADADRSETYTPKCKAEVEIENNDLSMIITQHDQS